MNDTAVEYSKQPTPHSIHNEQSPQVAPLAEEQGGAPSDDSDDEVADFRNLLPQLLAQGHTSTTTHQSDVHTNYIPKRGEKDFEPTGFKGQEKKLDDSRRAMKMVISQSRRCGSKALSTAIWRPDLNRALVQVSRGTTIASMGVTARNPITAVSPDDLPSTSSDVIGPDNQVGVWKAGIFYPRYSTRTELLPEEALFLIERGTLDCTTATKLRDSEEEVQIPLSLQHAFSLMMGKDGCTRERYQVYTYLKRLGYYVQRRSIADSLRSTAAAARRKELQQTDYDILAPTDRKVLDPTSIVANPDRPLKLVTLWDLALYIPRRLMQITMTEGSILVNWLRKVASSCRQKMSTTSQRNGSPSVAKGRGLLGLGEQQLASYDALFSALQIIPSGHDLISQEKTHEGQPDPRFQPFFYAWRPATRFRKTNPPLPEYRIAAISARDSSLPKLYEFQKMFEAVPLERNVAVGAATGGEGAGVTEVGSIDEAEEEEKLRAAAEKKRNDESYGRGFLAKKRQEEIAAARAAKKDGEGDSQGTKDLRSRLKELIASSLPPGLLLVAEATSTRLSSLLLLLARAFLHLPPTPSRAFATNNGSTRRKQGGGRGPFNSNRPHFGQQSQHRRPNPFPPLKAGRRDVILAVTDHGTTSMLRFGEAEFQKWRLMGDK